MQASPLQWLTNGGHCDLGRLSPSAGGWTDSHP
jgi:hypothetical protein